MFSISNKHEEFFDYLITNAENFHRSAEIASQVMNNIGTVSSRIKDVVDITHQADEINKEVIMKLCRVFITPIDREDFYRLTCVLSDCIDSLQGAIVRTDVYHVTQAPEAAKDITNRLSSMGNELKQIFVLLKSIDKNEMELMERANRLSQLETEIDALYRNELSRIFSEKLDVLYIIRWKDILGTLEETADNVEKLGNVIKEVTMKYA